LETHDLEVRSAVLFDRRTPLQGESGMENWLRQFKWFYFEGLPGAQRERALLETVEELRPVLFKEGKWEADYRRLRVVAVKV
jgi:trans-aconitate 2-methyltransferase